METKFASAERDSDTLVSRLFAELNGVPLIRELVDRTTELLLVLNQHRQVVFANKAFLDLLGGVSPEDVLGKRPGEALGCVHSGEVSGCGTTEFCIHCGAVNAILTAQETLGEAKEECLLSVKGGDSAELSVIAKPFEYMDNRFIIFTAKDISDIKRKTALEKIFFHDIMNLASGIYSVLDLVKDDAGAEELSEELLGLLHQSSSDMLREISEYRLLMQAEKREIAVMPAKLNSAQVMDNIHGLYKSMADKREVTYQKEDCFEDFGFKADLALMQRVIINMVKNAIEASSKGEKVSYWASSKDGKALFSVKNSSVMTEEVKRQIFKRTFTTKESGSGLGTYSMKLIAEKYLRGNISFVSEEGRGTIFTLEIPLGE